MKPTGPGTKAAPDRSSVATAAADAHVLGPAPAAMQRDQFFREPRKSMEDFAFGAEVAAVFDDMVDRSVPQYREIQRMVLELVADFAVQGTWVVDLGCSTGTTLAALDQELMPGVGLLGVDNSDEMLARCRQRLKGAHRERKLELVTADLNNGYRMGNASVALMILTLQFIRPLRRQRLMADIHRGLNDQGALILVEKVMGEDSLFNRLFIKYYYDMKRRHGYSELEISQKREALENVLIPYKLLENRELLLETGFRSVDVFFKWYNFCGMVAVK